MNLAGDDEKSEADTASVSVIIPCYNQARFLANAVESVLSQESVAVDVIVVDDGSSDDTGEVITRFGKSIRSICQINRGVCRARNRGLADARGEFILFLDSDDVLQAGAFERFISVAKANPNADVVYSGARLIDQYGNALCDVIPEDLGPDPLISLLLANRIAAPGTVFLRRRILDRIGDFDPQHSPSEDWDYWLRLAAGGATFVRLPEALLGYRQHEESHSRSYFTMVAAVRSVSSSHRDAAKRSLKHRLARHAGRRVMRYFCVNRALRPAIARLIRSGQWRDAGGKLFKAIFQDWEAPFFFLLEYWILAAAARMMPTVEIRATVNSEEIAADQNR